MGQDTYYFGADGVAQSGVQQVNEKLYLFDSTNYTMQTDTWAEVGGNTYYFGQDGAAVSGLVSLSEPISTFARSVPQTRLYYFNPTTFAMQKGMITAEDGNTYYFGTQGFAEGGVHTVDNKIYGFDDTTLQCLKNTAYSDENGTYYFGADGAALTDWQTIEGVLYYYTNSGTLIADGLQQIDADTYYFSGGTPAYGMVTVDGQLYSFDAQTGKMQKECFVTDANGNKYYMGTDGAPLIGWQTIGDKKYLFGTEGQLQTGFVQLASGRTAYADPQTGYLIKGFATIDQNYYYFDPTSYAMATGLTTIDYKTYYFAENGAAQKGLVAVGYNVWYFGDDYVQLNAPTITQVETLGTAMNQKTVIIHASFPEGQHAQAYSFDGGNTWQEYNYKVLSTFSDIPENQLRVRDAKGQITVYEYKVSMEKFEERGLDVSAYQPYVDWNQVKQAGYDFVIIRAAHWKNGTEFVADDWFRMHVINAKAAGLKVGAYYYAVPYNDAEIKQETDVVISTLQNIESSGYRLDYPVYVDYESPNLTDSNKNGGLTNASRTALLRSSMIALDKAGYYPAFYTFESFAVYSIHTQELLNEGYDFWIANFNGSVGTVGYTGRYDVWQYSSTGGVPGVTVDVDKNISYKDYATLIRRDKYNHWS
ncbi:MAG: GH25 family lysozyme [Oscillospiraceae bacterium]|nr:GH25 family lysozyme [Oscillospiraceae bacterium]